MTNVFKLWATFFIVCCFAMPNGANAQFFKKLEKALTKVDNVLGGTTTENKQSEESVPASTQDKPGQIHVATYGTKQAKPIIPHRTSTTKLITLDKAMPDISRFSEGAAYVFTGGDKGGFYIDTLGNKLFDFYAPGGMALMFRHGVIIYRSERTNTAYALNKKGEEVFKCSNALAVTGYSEDGIAAITVGIPSKQSRGMLDYINVFINTEGKLVFKNLIFGHTMEKLKEARPLRCGLAAFYNYQSKKWGYRDGEGKIIIPAQFEDAKDFSDKLALVKVKDSNGAYKWGYITLTGTFAINPIYSNEPGNFNNGLAPISDKERKRYYIDKTGKIVSKAFQDASEFHNGLAIVNDEDYSYIMDTSFHYVSVLNSSGYSFGRSSSYGSEPDIEWDGKDMYIKKSLVAPNGDALIRYVSDLYTGNYAPCRMPTYILKNDSQACGFINRKGEYIVEFIESQF